ncbi:MAG TPA: hypothetical protein VIM29_13800 [Bacillota bacterium]
MGGDKNIVFGGNDDVIQRTRQWVNVNQTNNSKVFVRQDADQQADQEEENEQEPAQAK